MSALLDHLPGATPPVQHLVIAHRGASALFPENTLPAFIEAIRVGAGIETDVRLTADDVPVLVHDRLIDGIPVDQVTLAQLRTRRPDVVTLRELLELCTSKQLLVIEIKYAGVRDKHGRIEEAVLAELDNVKRLDPENAGATVINSFSAGSLLRFRQRAPQLPLVQNLDGGWDPDGDYHLITHLMAGYAVGFAPSAADLPITAGLPAIPWSRYAASRGLLLLPYTPGSVKGPEENAAVVQAAFAAGCHGAFYNDPGAAGRQLGLDELHTSEAMLQRLAGLADRAIPPLERHGAITSQLVAFGNGLNLSVDDLRAAVDYSGRMEWPDVFHKASGLLADRLA